MRHDCPNQSQYLPPFLINNCPINLCGPQLCPSWTTPAAPTGTPAPPSAAHACRDTGGPGHPHSAPRPIGTTRPPYSPLPCKTMTPMEQPLLGTELNRPIIPARYLDQRSRSAQVAPRLSCPPRSEWDHVCVACPDSPFTSAAQILPPFAVLFGLVVIIRRGYACTTGR